MKDLIESVEAVTALGLMQGDENGSFKPKDNITKEQVIVTLLKLNLKVRETNIGFILKRGNLL